MKRKVLSSKFLLLIILSCSFSAFTQSPILIVDLDENNNSAPVIASTIDTLGVEYELLTNIPSELNDFEGIFICLGTFSNNHELSADEAQLLADYLNNGGSIYMEGGDTWFYDMPTVVHPMFNIQGLADGTSDLGIINGQDETFTQDMTFSYNGENNWIDHIEPIAPAFMIFENQSPPYGTGIAYDAGGYKTIGVSFEFGGLSDAISPSTKIELMLTYLDFMEIALSLEAEFYSSDTLICEGENVHFFDASGGNIVSWNWIFEGATPNHSSLQNPIVNYPNQGVWNVFLEVSDGIETSEMFLIDFITVESIPISAPEPTGISLLCANWGNTSYTTNGLLGVTEYEWLIEPPEAGTISGSGTNVTVVWEEDFFGDADLKVAGINFCGTGAYSTPLTITRYLPDVSLQLPAFVSLSSPPFELTGGSPIGGVYSGPGVTDGQFYPAEAGLGMHSITYTYTDINFCENFAVDSIGVTQYTGLNFQNSQNFVNIYPNPSNGNFQAYFNPKEPGIASLKLYNSLEKVIWEQKNVLVHQNYSHYIQLENEPTGIYYLRITGQKYHSSVKIIIQ